MGNMQRFYFWEEVPGYGRRQTGYTKGYATLEALKADLDVVIDSNRRDGIPSWVLRAEVHEVLVPRGLTRGGR